MANRASAVPAMPGSKDVSLACSLSKVQRIAYDKNRGDGGRSDGQGGQGSRSTDRGCEAGGERQGGRRRVSGAGHTERRASTLTVSRGFAVEARGQRRMP